MSDTPPLTPLSQIPLERHKRHKKMSTFWRIIALGLVFNAGLCTDKYACRDEALAVRTPDAGQKEERKKKREEALRLSEKCHMQLLLDTRNQCRRVTEAEIRKQFWECERLKQISESE
jgi:hypothetical protein